MSEECPRCGTERKCQSFVSEKGKACRIHGGASPKGIGHPGFKDGRFSKYMPGNLSKKHNEFINDPNWLTLVNELAVLRAIMAKHLEDLDGMAPLEMWKRAEVLWNEAKAANDKGDLDLYSKRFFELGEVLTEGIAQTIHHDKTIASIYKDADGIRRMVESEKNLAITKDEMIPIAIIFGIADLFLRSLRDEVAPLDGGTEATRQVGKEVYDYLAKYLGAGHQPDSNPNIVEIRTTD